MGKAGKARKRMRVESVKNNTIPADSESESESDSGAPLSSKSLRCAIALLDALGKLPDLYSDKKFKALRIALFPLITEQKDCFFEPGLKCNASVAEVEKLCTPSAISATIAVAGYFSVHIEEFKSSVYKDFRRALHPLVTAHKEKQSGGKSKKGSDIKSFGNQRVAKSSSGTDEPSGTERNVGVDSKSFIHTTCNHISACFRAKEWQQALECIRSLSLHMRDAASTASSAHTGDCPKLKLGLLQRWVRDCDVLSRDTDTIDDKRPSYTEDIIDSSSPIYTEELCEKDLIGNNYSLLLMHAVLQLIKVTTRPGASNTLIFPKKVKINRHRLFQPQAGICSTLHPVEGLSYGLQCKSSTSTIPGVHIISHVAGADRRPPTKHDLNVYLTDPGTVTFRDTVLPARHNVPNIPGAFLMTNVLSPEECDQFITLAEKIGYMPDAVDGVEGIVWLADESILNPIFTRCKPLITQVDGMTGELFNVNARFRMFRYECDSVYRPHIDGAWPGSGLVPANSKSTTTKTATIEKPEASIHISKVYGDQERWTTKQHVTGISADANDLVFSDDAFNDNVHSKLTFLVYLNGDFEGGATTFFVPKIDPTMGGGEITPGNTSENTTPSNGGERVEEVDTIEAVGVKPQQGCVLCFPHGTSLHSLVHEGSAVKPGGVKYIIRTDVLFKLT